MNRFLSFILLISFIIINVCACSKKNDNQCKEKRSDKKIAAKDAKKIIKIPNFYLSRTIMELQIRLVRAFKVGAYKDLNKYLLGGLIKDPCDAKSSDFDWQSCFGNMDKQSIQLVAKKKVECPSDVPDKFKSKKCPATRYCKRMSFTLKNKNGVKKIIEFNDVAKVAGKWWVIGKVKCSSDSI